MVEIDGDRLLRGLATLRSFGATGGGVVRTTFSDIDMAAREWLAEQMRAAGLDARIDGAGNVLGRSPNEGAGLLIGSHSDTQPRGGWLDGALGVMYGIEIAHAFLRHPDSKHLVVDAVAWSDEEGTYTSCLGSRSFVGALTDEDWSATSSAGESVAEAIERAGLNGRPPARFDPDRHRAYLEAHIEQGPHLEDRGLAIGVVTSIVGIRAVEIIFTGQQNHAGTTPMDRRRDAAVAMFEFGHRLQGAMASAAGPTSVWTSGVVHVEPGAQSIIPGRAVLGLQFRDPEDTTLDRMEAAARSLAAETDAAGTIGIEVVARRQPIRPTVMDPVLRGHLATAAEARRPGRWMEMSSAAGHDPMVLSHHLPCAMLFIPSIDGISHDFAEDSHPEDIVTGCQVLADAAVPILRSWETAPAV